MQIIASAAPGILEPGTIDPQRIDTVVTRRLFAAGLAARAVFIPILWIAVVALYGPAVPAWMHVLPVSLYLAAVLFGWRLHRRYERDPDALDDPAWRLRSALLGAGLALALGVMGVFFATLPGPQERLVGALILILAAGLAP